MIKNHVVAKDGFEPPIARSELAVLPLHYMAFKTAYLHRLAVDNILFHFKFINMKNFIANKNGLLQLTRCQTYVDEAGLKPATLVQHKVLSIKLLDLKNTSILTNRCSTNTIHLHSNLTFLYGNKGHR